MREETNCSICLNKCTAEINGNTINGYYYYIRCPRCGIFRVNSWEYGRWKDDIFTERERSKASSRVRELGEGVHISHAQENYLFRANDLTVLEKTDRLLLEIQKKTNFVGETVEIASSNFHLMAKVWALSWDEMKGLLHILDQKFWIGFRSEISKPTVDVFIKEGGWERLDELRAKNIESSQGFVAMWFDQQVNHIYSECIGPAIEQAGYQPLRIDKKEYAGKIDDEIIMQIRRSRFLIADFTGHRGGVYYEAGFAHGLGIKVFFSCRDDYFKDLHFDISHYNCIRWFPDKLQEYKNALAVRIEAELGKGPHR